MRTLYIIPARGGSKGIPGKNIKLLGGKPLILWSTELARSIAEDADICVTSDDAAVIRLVEQSGLKVPFKRPADLATDVAGTQGVMLHALDFYQQQGIIYDAVVLLQPTSPFRKKAHLSECLTLFNLNNTDMVVSVKESDANPYYNIFEECGGFLNLSKGSGFTRRQDCPTVYQYNGSVYTINAKSLRERPMSEFRGIRKYVMPAIWSVDLDVPTDWLMAEMILQHGLLAAS